MATATFEFGHDRVGPVKYDYWKRGIHYSGYAYENVVGENPVRWDDGESLPEIVARLAAMIRQEMKAGDPTRVMMVTVQEGEGKDFSFFATAWATLDDTLEEITDIMRRWGVKW
jgi:hypothetical protein